MADTTAEALATSEALAEEAEGTAEAAAEAAEGTSEAKADSEAATTATEPDDHAVEPTSEAIAEEDTVDTPEEEGDQGEAKTVDQAEPADDDSAEASETQGEIDVVEEPPLSPYDLPGGWFVIHSYSGYENKVKANLETRIRSMHLEDKVFDVVIPMEDVVEYKGGKKVTVERKKFPGYVLVRMYLEDDTWYAVRNTPSVTGFVGASTQPSPLSRREVERILGVEKEDGTKKEKPTFKPAWEVGETIRVVEGPFADFNGLIEDINVDQSKVRVLVDIFGRETPVELNFDQIVKY
jgi:transcriptional antiterminator NusG